MRRYVAHPGRLRSLAVALALLAGTSAALACADVFRGDMVRAERDVGATRVGEAASWSVLGAGWFHAAEIVKHGGSSDNTSVTLELDGEPITTASFADLKNPWREINTPFIVVKVRSVGNTSTMTLWYAPELMFRFMAALRIEVREEGVDSLKLRTVMNKPAPHVHTAGGLIGPAVALPAFK
jgi:hypothetical protein